MKTPLLAAILLIGKTAFAADSQDLIRAARAGSLSDVQALIRAGVDVDSRSPSKATALEEAAESGHVDVVRFLLDNGADADAKDNGRDTALARLANYQPLFGTSQDDDCSPSCELATARLLLDRGAQVDSHDYGSETPLMMAASRGKVDLVQLLLQRGANPNAADFSGDTPLIHAARLGQKETVDVLLQHGASRTASDEQGLTALDWACVFWEGKAESCPRSEIAASLAAARTAQAELAGVLGKQSWLIKNPRGANDRSEAVSAVAALAEQGNVRAQILLGILYSGGYGLDKDDRKATHWLEKAAATGDAEAEYHLGILYKFRSGTSGKKESLAWLKKAAEHGNLKADHSLGQSYELGEGVPKDEAVAASWYRRAAEKGYASAQLALGFLYSNGKGVPHDDRIAAEWFKKAADQDDESGEGMLGMSYHYGTGVPQDDAQAVVWYRKAALQGNSQAKKELETLLAQKPELNAARPTPALTHSEVAADKANLGASVDQSLVKAAVAGDVSKVEDALHRGADVNATDKDGWSALMEAALKGYEDVARVLIDHHANIEALNNDGLSALMIASTKDQFRVAKQLIAAGAQVNAKGSGDVTALYGATSVRMAKLFVDHGADVNARDKSGMTALMGLAFQGNQDVAKFLLDHAANVNAQDKDGSSALVAAAVSGHTEMVRLLLTYDADANLKTKEGGLPLQVATNADIVNLLIAHGANVNSPGFGGFTPLMEAGNSAIAEALLVNGAEANARTDKGWTALMRAAATGRAGVIGTLLRHEASVRAKDVAGRTAADLACSQWTDEKQPCAKEAILTALAEARSSQPSDPEQASSAAETRSQTRRGAAIVSEDFWPDLSKPLKPTGGGENDAAVIVGAERYAFVEAIPGAQQNAGDWQLYLTETRKIPVDHVALLESNDATLEQMRKAIEHAAAQVRPGGTLWFIFIGHGAPSNDGKDGLLVGVDAQQKADSVYARSLSRNSLLGLLAKGQQAKTVVLLDACFSGKTSSGGSLIAGLQPLLTVRSTPPGIDNRVVLMTAAQSDQFAGPLPGGNRPAFSYLALGAMRGWASSANGSVTASGVVEYARKVLSLLHDRQQTPELSTPSAGTTVLGKGRETGPDLSRIQREAAASSGGFEVSTNMPSVPRASRPVSIEAAARGLDLSGIDVGALERYNATLKVDKGDGPPNEKASAWRGLAANSPAFETLANKRAAEWDAFAEQERTAQSAIASRIQTRDSDWEKLSRLLQLDPSVSPLTSKRLWSRDFLAAYLKSPGIEPEMAKTLIPYTQQGATQTALRNLAKFAGRAGVRWITIPGGSFMMGSENGRSDEMPLHRVSIKSFQIARTLVTNRQYNQCVNAGVCSPAGHCGDSLKGDDDRPVVCVTWNQAREFSKWVGGRLPTEAEWEYAARSGGKSWKYPWGNDAPTCDVAVFKGCANSTMPVCSRPVGNTEQGLCDMAGNGWEWVQDSYHPTYKDAPLDGRAWESPYDPDINRSYRGGSWETPTESIRSANRGQFVLFPVNGFRPAR